MAESSLQLDTHFDTAYKTGFRCDVIFVLSFKPHYDRFLLGNKNPIDKLIEQNVLIIILTPPCW